MTDPRPRNAHGVAPCPACRGTEAETVPVLALWPRGPSHRVACPCGHNGRRMDTGEAARGAWNMDAADRAAVARRDA